MISDIFVSRPRLAFVLSLIITVLGALALTEIPVAQYPSVAPPTVQVGAAYPGADAETVELAIAQPLESALSGISGLKYMKSTSGANGSYSLTVSFDVGTDTELAAVAVQDRIASVLPAMPAAVRQVGMSVTKASGDLLLVFSLYSPDDSRDELFLSNYASLNLVDGLKRIEGVGNVQIFGQRDYAMRIWLDAARMNQLGFTVDQVMAALADQNANAALGSIGAPPVPTGQAVQLTISTKGQLATVEEFQNIVLRDEPNGGPVTLGEVARIEVAAVAMSSVARLQGHAAVAVGIYLSPGANAVLVADAVTTQMTKAASALPSGVASIMVLNNAEFVDAMINTVIATLLTAFALVSLVVFVFVGRISATVIPLVAAPVSIIGALGILYLLGFSINAITLLALVLAIGIVVDDAIIVAENAGRVMEENPALPPVEATRQAMREIAPSIIAITLVLLAVFIPVAFLPGATGVLFRQFAAAVSGGVVISALNALTLSPAIAALILRPGQPMLLMRGFTRIVDVLTFGYTGVVRLLLKVSAAAVLLALVFAGLSWQAVQTTPSGYVPDEDKGFLYVIMSLPPAASMERTDQAARLAETILEKDPAVDSVATVLGIDFLGGGSASNGGVFFVKLKAYEERTSADLSAFATVARLRGSLAPIAEAIFIPANPPAIDGLGQIGGLQYVLEAQKGQGLDEMSTVARSLSQAAAALPELAGVFGAEGNDTPRIRLDIDRGLAAELGVGMGSIYATLQAMLDGASVNNFNQFGKSWQVRLQADGAYRDAPDDILNLYVRSASGSLIPLSAFAAISAELGPRLITRYNNSRAMILTAAPKPGIGSGSAIAALADLSAKTLPEGYGFEWTGQALEETTAAEQTEVVIGLAVFFAFLFLVGLYESWSIPLAVLLSVSVALCGALYSLGLFGLSFDVYAQIGLVVLIALAAKNAILVNSFALERRKAGLGAGEAALEAAKLRFRPVMMTSVAFIAGLVPLATATGPGAAAMKAVGTPVLSGMLAAAVVGVFVIPMLFLVFQRLRELRGWKLQLAPSDAAALVDDPPRLAG